MAEEKKKAPGGANKQKPKRLIAERYEVVNQLMGGMGIVYLCRDQFNNQLVALKTFKPEFLSHVAARDLFLREGTMWVELGRHPHIVQAYRVERIGDGREVYLVLEWIVQPKGKSSPSLRSWLRGGKKLPPDQALLFALHVARGMRYATSKIAGMVHRDLKPENILVGYDGMARVTDFGLASTLSGLARGTTGILPNKRDNFGRTQMTQGVAGTPLYMAPEQWEQHQSQLDARADIYALGCILYEMVNGRFAAEGETREDLQEIHTSGRIKPPDPDTPREVLLVLRSCLAVKREKRYRNWKQAEAGIEEAYAQLTGKMPPPERSSTEETAEDRVMTGHSYNTMGLSYLDIGKLDVAVMYFEQAVNLARQENAVRLEGVGLGNLGLANMALGYLRRAIEFHDEHLAIARELEDRAEEAKALGHLGHTYLRLGDVDGAIRLHEKELIIFRQLHDQLKEASALHSLGDAYRQSGDVEQAVNFYKQSLAIAREINDRTRVGRILNSMGLVYLDAGESKEAVTLFQQAYEIAREIGDRVGEGQILTNLGDLYQRVNRLDRAIEFYNRSLAVAEESNNRRYQILNLKNLGDVYLSKMEPEEAEICYTQALAVVQDTGDQMQEMAINLKLGEVYQDMGDFMKTASLVKRALFLARQREDRVVERQALEALGVAYERYGDLGRTAEYFEESIALSESLKEMDAMQASLAYLANIYRRAGQWKSSAATFQRLLELGETLENWRMIGEAHNYLGDVVRQSGGESRYAMEEYRAAYDVARDHSLSDLEATALANIGVVYFDQGKHWRANWHLNKAVSLAKKLKNVPVMANVSYKNALVLCRQDKWAQAKPHAEIAGKLYHRMKDEEMVTRVRKMLDAIEQQKGKMTGLFF